MPPSGLPLVRAVHPQPRSHAVIEAPASLRARAVIARGRAGARLVRGRLEGARAGDRSRARRAARHRPPRDIDAALTALEVEGFVAARALHRRGAHAKRNGATAACWRASTATPSSACAPRSSRCRPRELHALPVRAGSASQRRRAHWKARDGAGRGRGATGRLRGRAPAPGRPSSCRRASHDYEPRWLDDLCLAGRGGRGGGLGRAGGRTRERGSGADPQHADRAARRAVATRAVVGRSARRPTTTVRALEPRAQSVHRAPARARRLVLRRPACRPAACCARRSRRRSPNWWRRAGQRRQLRRPARPAGAAPTGASGCAGGRRKRPQRGARRWQARWPLSVARRPARRGARRAWQRAAESSTSRAALLRRYGVVFWRAAGARGRTGCRRGASCCTCCRRLEARGEIRGGRFVAGFSGEQFALPEAVGLLRDAAHASRRARRCCRCAAPTRSTWSACSRRARACRHSPPTACCTATACRSRLLAGGEVRFLEALTPAEQWQAQNALVRRHVPAALADFSAQRDGTRRVLRRVRA
ncbi:MAG: hypothetical protein MZV70_37485 [Desulfobacterales bacterium]|nr:hypothetical protein [Desulfobacterales bacterium]